MSMAVINDIHLVFLSILFQRILAAEEVYCGFLLFATWRQMLCEYINKSIGLLFRFCLNT